MVAAFMDLAGERHAPGMPIPRSAIEAYAKQARLGFGFVKLVAALDRMQIAVANMPEEEKTIEVVAPRKVEGGRQR